MRALRLLPLLFPLALLSGTPALSGCDSDEVTCEDTTPFETVEITEDGVELGETIEVLDCVSVSYVGRLAGTSETFDEGSFSPFLFTTQPRSTPRGERYRVASFIPGFVLGMGGMQVGETRRVTIPPSLGYRNEDRLDADGDVVIPACSTLEFDITLTSIRQDLRDCLQSSP